MPSPPRILAADAIYHATSRGNNQRSIFHGDQDRRLFVAELERVVIRRAWRCLSFCLLPNHFHLIVETPGPDLSEGMRDLLSRFVKKSNQRRGADGRAFKDRFFSKRINTDAYLATALRYVALNAVNAGLCRDPSSYRWSNHGALVAGREGSLAPVARIEELLGVWGGEPGCRYAALMAEQHQRWGGWADAVDPAPPRPTLAVLLASLPAVEAMIEARRAGYRLWELAAATGLSEATISRRTRAERNTPGVFLSGSLARAASGGEGE